MKVDGGIQSSTFLHSGKMTKTLSLCLSPEKYLLMLQSIKRAVHIEPNNPWLHQCLVRFFKGGKCDLLWATWTAVIVSGYHRSKLHWAVLYTYSEWEHGSGRGSENGAEARDLQAVWREQPSELQQELPEPTLQLHPTQTGWYANLVVNVMTHCGLRHCGLRHIRKRVWKRIFRSDRFGSGHRSVIMNKESFLKNIFYTQHKRKISTVLKSFVHSLKPGCNLYKDGALVLHVFWSCCFTHFHFSLEHFQHILVKVANFLSLLEKGYRIINTHGA